MVLLLKIIQGGYGLLTDYRGGNQYSYKELKKKKFQIQNIVYDKNKCNTIHTFIDERVYINPLEQDLKIIKFQV